jgi:DNA replication protein DnaC
MEETAQRAAKTLEDLRQAFLNWKERHRPAPVMTVAETEAQRRYFEAVHNPAATVWPVPVDLFKANVWGWLQTQGFTAESVETSKTALNALCAYFSGNEGELSLDKGIYLYGGCGVGKTTIFRAMQKARLKFRRPLAMTNLPVYCAEVLEGSAETLTTLASKERVYDDAGAENAKIMQFGNARHIFPELIMIGYERLKRDGIMMHLTTNLAPSEIITRTGVDERVRSRLNEMFNIVLLDGVDNRG